MTLIEMLTVANAVQNVSAATASIAVLVSMASLSLMMLAIAVQTRDIYLLTILRLLQYQTDLLEELTAELRGPPKIKEPLQPEKSEKKNLQSLAKKIYLAISGRSLSWIPIRILLTLIPSKFSTNDVLQAIDQSSLLHYDIVRERAYIDNPPPKSEAPKN